MEPSKRNMSTFTGLGDGDIFPILHNTMADAGDAMH